MKHKKSTKYQQKESGFTLAEIIIYTALTSFILTSFVSFSLVIISLKNKISLIIEASVDAIEIRNYLNREVKQAESVLEPSPGQTSGILLLKITGGGTKEIKAENGLLKAIDSGRKEFIVVSGRTKISGLNFKNLASQYEAPAILTEMEVGAGGQSQDFIYSQNLRILVSSRR